MWQRTKTTSVQLKNQANLNLFYCKHVLALDSDNGLPGKTPMSVLCIKNKPKPNHLKINYIAKLTTYLEFF